MVSTCFRIRGKVLCTALTESAADVLGYEKSYQPDWFKKSFVMLDPLLHRLYTTLLAASKEKDHVQFKQTRIVVVRKVIRKEND